jgi:hypothetical protein
MMFASSGHYELVHNEREVRKFYDMLGDLLPEEAYFLSMSARNKYLTEEERKQFELGRTEMFARKLVKTRSFEIFMRTVRSFEVAHGGYLSRGNVPLPDKCLVVYANINPVSGRKALQEFYSKTTQLLFDLSTSKEAASKLSSLDTELMNCYQRAKGTKNLIDIDFDVPEDGFDLVERFVSLMRANGITVHVIRTRSGYHVLLQRADIKFNYVAVVNELHSEAVKRFGHAEVVVNRNDMCPLAGTLQACFPVRFMDI